MITRMSKVCKTLRAYWRNVALVARLSRGIYARLCHGHFFRADACADITGVICVLACGRAPDGVEPGGFRVCGGEGLPCECSFGAEF